MFYVYCHTNQVNGKKYIGVTNNPKRRWRCGGIEYKPTSGDKENRFFYNAIRKYGFKSFDREILRKVDTAEEAFELEKRLIAELLTNDKRYGYNISPGGNGGRVYKEHPRNMLGKPQTAYQIANQKKFMSKAKNNPMLNGDVVWGITHPHPRGFAGHKRTDEFKNRVSKMLKENPPKSEPVTVYYPDGRVEYYKTMKSAETGVGLTKPTLLKIARSGEPFSIKVRNQSTDKISHLEGLVVIRETTPR